jgi:uncharacterized coiled-coil protein SlyX
VWGRSLQRLRESSCDADDLKGGAGGAELFRSAEGALAGWTGVSFSPGDQLLPLTSEAWGSQAAGSQLERKRVEMQQGQSSDTDALRQPLSETASGWVSEHTPRFEQIYQAFEARIQQQQEQIERIKNTLATRATGLEQQSADLAELVAKVQALSQSRKQPDVWARSDAETPILDWEEWDKAVQEEETANWNSKERIDHMDRAVAVQCTITEKHTEQVGEYLSEMGSFMNG